KAIEKFLQLDKNAKMDSKHLEEENQHPESANRIVVKVKNEIKIIPLEEVKFMEANDDYVNIYTAEGKFIKNKTLSFFEKTLDPLQFVRVHRSYLVKVSEISKIEPYEKDSYVLKLRDGQSVPVSKTGFPKLKTVLGI
ncbi:MAG: LytTR family transcriptional regulator, partial [Cyclobacteriaceae bacterium]|nr:LytTR family transcriptional regulator [Cyclobacteriaceae bacterium]